MFATSLSTVEPFAGNPMYEVILDKWVAGDSIGDDKSMVATLRSLLHSRSEETFHSWYVTNNNAPSQVPDGNDMFKRILGDSRSGEHFTLEQRTMFIVNLSVEEAAFKKSCEYLEKAEKNPWTSEAENKVLRIKAAEEYIYTRAHNDVRLYVFPEIDSCVIIVRNLNYPCLHLIESFTPLYFPRLFKEKPITTDERAMLESLTQRDPESYKSAIAKLAAQYDFREQVIEANLVQFELQNRERMLEAAKNQLDAIRQRADQAANEYQAKLFELQESTIRFEGLRQMKEMEKNNRELADYFIAHKNLRLVRVDGPRMDFIVSTFLDSFDIDAYNHFKENRDIYRHYRASGPFAEEDNRALLMDNIFSEEPLFKIKTCAFYSINLGGSVTSSSHYNYGQYNEYNDCIPNPHLNYHNCIGQNRTLICEQLIKSETIGAIECCIASATAVNIHETTQTFRPFMNELFANERHVLFNTETKEDMTPREALKWLKDRRTEK